MASLPLIGITTSEVRRPEINHPLPESEPPQFELALGMPVLGICRGAQTLNVARGGSLVQHVGDHRQVEPGSKVTHEVSVEPGTRLAPAAGAETPAGNSFPHPAPPRVR